MYYNIQYMSGGGNLLVGFFTVPLDSAVTASVMLGVEPERRGEFKIWSDDVVRATRRPTDEAERAQIRKSEAAFHALTPLTFQVVFTFPCHALDACLLFIVL